MWGLCWGGLGGECSRCCAVQVLRWWVWGSPGGVFWGALRGSGLACPWVVLGVCWDGGRRCPGWPVRACGEAVKTLLRSWQPVGVLAWAKSSRSRVMSQAPRRMPCACLVGGAGAWWLDEG